jgi:hypothetical protein
MKRDCKIPHIGDEAWRITAEKAAGEDSRCENRQRAGFTFSMGKPGLLHWCRKKPGSGQSLG